MKEIKRAVRRCLGDLLETLGDVLKKQGGYMKERIVLMIIKWILENYETELGGELSKQGMHLHFNPKKKVKSRVKVLPENKIA